MNGRKKAYQNKYINDEIKASFHTILNNDNILKRLLKSQTSTRDNVILKSIYFDFIADARSKNINHYTIVNSRPGKIIKHITNSNYKKQIYLINAINQYKTTF